jgi:hypothetical protein
MRADTPVTCGYGLGRGVRGREFSSTRSNPPRTPRDRLSCHAVRHEALVLPDGGERPPSPRCRSGGVKLEATATGGRRDVVRAASTKSHRLGTAGRVECGEPDEKVYARNR